MSRRAFTDRDHTLAQNLLDKVRRTASNNDEGEILYDPQHFNAMRLFLGHRSMTLAFMRSKFESLHKLQQAIINLIKLRLQAQGVQFPALNATNMSWCIPLSLGEEPAWRLLMEDPLLFTCDMLEPLMPLTKWSPDTPSPSPGTNTLYIRTFEIPVVVLSTVLNAMQEDGFDTHARMDHWQKRIHNESDDNAIYILRYCGQTTGNPWNRHSGDMYMNLKTFFGRFLRQLGQTAQGIKVLSNATVHSVSGIINQASTEMTDLREQVLIALFGHGTLNTQSGGKDVITLFKEDRDHFDRLKTQTIKLLTSETRACNEAELDQIQDYARAVGKYVSKNPSTVGSANFTQHTEAMIFRQATPSMLLNGSAVMVTLGSDLGEEHEDTEDVFWVAKGRSADAVTRIYNFFSSWEGPTALEAIDPNATKNLASYGHLPLVDLFPWFSKHEKDYLKASELLRRYMNAAKPMIILAYGQCQIYAGLASFRSFDARSFGSWCKMRQNYGEDEQIGQPYLCYFDGNESDNHDPNTATVLIPSLHPGFLSRAGMIKEKATRVFVLTSAVAWCAMSAALTIAHEGLPDDREQFAKSIIAKVESMTGQNTTFGASLATARKEYEDCRQAYSEGQAHRRKAPMLKTPKGILAKKSIRAKRKTRYTTTKDIPEGGIGGWCLEISKASTYERSHELFNLKWKEDDGGVQEIGPLPLSKDICSTKGNPKRFIFFVSEGVDIRGTDGASLGLRSPLASGKSKSITLPISAILCAMSVDHVEAALDFIEHWEDLTGIAFLDEIDSTHPDISIDPSDGYIPASFFDNDLSRVGLPYPPGSLLSKQNMPKFLSKAQSRLPAKPGDLLWLLERFLLETFPTGGDIDPVSVSEHPTYSVFAKLIKFARGPKYQHHPHINTLKAMAHLSEQGADDRRIPINFLLLAIELLRPGYTSKGKQLGRTLPDGTKILTSRVVRTILAGPALSTVISGVAIPDLVSSAAELGEVEDITDDEALADNESGSSDKDIDEEDEMDWIAHSKAEKRKFRDGSDNDDNGGKEKDDKEDSIYKKRSGVRRTNAI